MTGHEDEIPTPAALSGTVTMPDALAAVEQVQSVRTPIRMTYDFVPGEAAQQYLNAFGDAKITGQRSPVDGAVFTPPRGVDPRHGVATTETVELGDRGHVGSFCVTRVPIKKRPDLEPPYVSAWIFLDGADIGFLGLVAGVDSDDVHIGMRVEAVWKPESELGRTAENILYWKPTGEPSLAFDEAGVRSWTGEPTP